MRDRVFKAMSDTKLDLEFLCLYIERQRSWLRYFSMSVLIFSASGIMGWKLWDGIPVIACVIIAAVSLLRLLQPHIIMDEKQISSLDKMYLICRDNFINLEKLWYELEENKKTEDEIALEFHLHRTSELCKEYDTLSFLAIRSKPKKLTAQAEKVTHDYFNHLYTSNSITDGKENKQPESNTEKQSQ